MKYFVFILFIGLSVNIFSQQDSVKKRMVREVEIQNDISHDLDFNSMDTIINKFYHFDLNGIDGELSTGNPGSATEPLSLEESNFGFHFGESAFYSQFREISKNILYKTNIPFARMSYISGPKKYQNFNMLFTENVSSTMNFAIKLKSFGSDGFYLNQSNSNRYFSIQNSYKSKSNRYGYYVKFSVQSGSIEENGGIKGDSIYLNSLQGDKLNVQVWFDDLSTNFYDKRVVDIHQFYRFGKVDSLHSKHDGLFVLLDNKGIVEDLWYDNQRTDSLYFSEFNLVIPDSVFVNDRAHLFGLENALSLKFRDASGKVDVRFGYGLDLYKTETLISDSSINAHSLTTGLVDYNLGNYKLNVKFTKGVSGYNSDGYKFNGILDKFFFNGRLFTSFSASSVKSLPDYKYLKYAGSEVSWDNQFGYVKNNSLGLILRMDSLGLLFSGKIRQTSNYVYYGRNVRPIQFNESFGSYEFRLEKRFVLKSYHFDVNVIYQGVEEQAPVNMANWIWSLSFYYQRYLFKGALELRYGIEYWQNTAYTSNYYAPFTRSFVYQNEYKTGNYPYVDFYVSGRIKSAQGFVKFQNLGQLVLNESYMMTPLYPMQDFGFSFGLRWDFFN